jgi:hypothetical protein
MSYFSELDIALQEKKQGTGRENISVNSVGVCLADSGQPVKLYIVDTIYACGSLDVFPLDKADPDYENPRQVESADFWCLV